MWWCPWIHDLGLMAGCVRHGFMNINAMRGDSALPLNPGAVNDHITRALVVGVEDPVSHMEEDFPTAGVVPSPSASNPSAPSGGGAAGSTSGNGKASGGGGGSGYSIANALAVAAAAVRAGKGFDGTDGRVQAWLAETCSEFPTRRAAEERVFRICMALTKPMPLGSPLRVRCYNSANAKVTGSVTEP
ncbi:unnamed protein product [Ectocarpus sp. 12 AP-2014]